MNDGETSKLRSEYPCFKNILSSFRSPTNRRCSTDPRIEPIIIRGIKLYTKMHSIHTLFRPKIKDTGFPPKFQTQKNGLI